MESNEGKRQVEELTQKTLDSGGILAQLYFDMESEKQDELQPLMADLVNNRLLKTQGVIYCFGGIDEPVKLKDTYSTSAQITVLVDSLWTLIYVMFTFTPAGVEVIKPAKGYNLKATDMHNILLNIAQTSLEYNNYILNRVLSAEDYEKVKEQMKSREELGKKLLEKKQRKPEGAK